MAATTKGFSVIDRSKRQGSRQRVLILDVAPDFPEAKCKGKGDLFFSYSCEALYQARNICFTCPHLGECNKWATDNEHHGMWGGKLRDSRLTDTAKRFRKYERMMDALYDKMQEVNGRSVV